MREIKFRAWDKEFEMMFYPTHDGQFEHLKGERTHELCGGRKPQGSLDYMYESGRPVMQYTGLKDKNGVEIYEGDIVKKIGFNLVSESYTNPYPAEIGDIFFVRKLDSGFTLIRARRFDSSTSLDTPNVHGNIDNYAFWNGHRHCEVIGNIYENKELLNDH